MVEGGQQLVYGIGPLAYRHGVVVGVSGLGGGVGDLGHPGLDLGRHELLGERAVEALVEASPIVVERRPGGEQRVTGC